MASRLIWTATWFPKVGTFNADDLTRVKNVIASFNDKVRNFIDISKTYTNRFVEAAAK
jgi:hypothetical protein